MGLGTNLCLVGGILDHHYKILRSMNIGHLPIYISIVDPNHKNQLQIIDTKNGIK